MLGTQGSILDPFFGQRWSPQEALSGFLVWWWSPKPSSASPTLFLLQPQRLLVITFTSIQHSSQNSTVCTHSKAWAGLGSYNNMAMGSSQPWSMMNGKEKLQAWFCSCPSRTRALINKLVICSRSHSDLMSPFYYGDVCQENPTQCTGGKWGRERKERGWWGRGEKRICRHQSIYEAISNNSVTLATSHFWSSGWPQRDLKPSRPLRNQRLPWKWNNRHTCFDVWWGDIL